MKEQSPEKTFTHLLHPTETLIRRVQQDTGLFIGLIEAASFQLEKFRTYTVGPDKAQLNNLKGHLDAVIAKHRAAEKKANPEGYARYDESFDVSAELIIDVLQAMRTGDLKIEETPKAA